PSTRSSPMPCTQRAAKSPCRSCTPADTRSVRNRSPPARSKPRSTPSPPVRSPTRRSSAPSRTSSAPPSSPEAGYDGVEIMGSEGYLINQFIASATNRREGPWGGTYENRMRFPLEIVRRTRARVGDDFILVYRLSMLDLVPGGSTFPEVVQLAKAVEEAGA